MPADVFLALIHYHAVAAGGRNPGILETGGSRPNHKHALWIMHFGHRFRAPDTFAPDDRVVDALNTSAPRDRAPAIVGCHARTDIFFPAFLDLGHPLLVGKHLATKQDRVSVASGNKVLGHVRVVDTADHQDRLRRDILDGAGILSLPSRSVCHRSMDVGVMHSG